MAKLAFSFLPSESSNDHQVRVLLDGMDVLADIDQSALGLDPVEFFSQSSLLGSGMLLIGRCGCGCVGCGDVSVEVFRNADEVEWFSEYPPIGRITFDIVEHDRVISTGSDDHSWETVERTAERLISELDFSNLKSRDLIFEWASGRIDKDQITLSFSRKGQQQLVNAPWDHQDPLAAVLAVQKLLQSWP